MITWCTWITASGNSTACGRSPSRETTGEFMLLRYAEDARLYVPLARVDLIQKYQSLGGATPQLDRLGTNLWETRKARVKKSVGDMAQKLLALYAERQVGAVGHSFPDGYELAKGIRRRIRISGDARSGESRQRREARFGICATDGPLAVRRRRLRQDGSGHARGVQGGGRFDASGGACAHYRAGLPALRNFPAQIRGVSGAHRNAQPLPHRPRAEKDSGGGRSRKSGYRDRHSPAALEGREIPESRFAGGGRRAALRRRAQRAHQGNAQECGRADDVGYADSAHAAHVAGGICAICR